VHRIRCTAVAGVALLALIAAVRLVQQMHELCLRRGKERLAAVLITLAVDDLIVVASMSILLASRYGSPGGLLAWSLASLGLTWPSPNLRISMPVGVSSPIAGANSGESEQRMSYWGNEVVEEGAQCEAISDDPRVFLRARA
jgi:hypothetical protein